jgi:hypothetical protein
MHASTTSSMVSSTTSRSSMKLIQRRRASAVASSRCANVILAQHRSSLCSPGHGHGHLAASPSFEALRATCLQRPSSDLEHCVLACRQTVCTRSSLTSLSQKQRCPPRSIASAVPKFIEQEQIFNAENPSRQLYLSVQDQVYGTYGTRT